MLLSPSLDISSGDAARRIVPSAGGGVVADTVSSHTGSRVASGGESAALQASSLGRRQAPLSSSSDSRLAPPPLPPFFDNTFNTRFVFVICLQLFVVHCSLPRAEQRRLVAVAHACAPAASLHQSHALLFWRCAVDAALGGGLADVCIGMGSRLCKHSRFHRCFCCCRCHCRCGWRRSGAKRAQKRNCKLAGTTFGVKALNWYYFTPSLSTLQSRILARLSNH